MGIVVQKYGGSSVADADSIKRVASRIVDYKKAGHEVVVVVSAMGDTTDELIDLAEQVTPKPPARELDMLLTAGERISMALLSMAINVAGVEARSFTGSQAGIITDDSHGKAKIIDVTPGRISEALSAGYVAIVAGFQGVSQTTKDITTLGRGGSDTTAVALAAALEADVCEIYTDVDGIFTADPRVVKAARQVPFISAEEMLDLAASGAKVLLDRCVEYARRYSVPLHVRSSFSGKVGTLITDFESARDFPVSATEMFSDARRQEQENSMEQAIISGVAHDRSEAKVTILGVPDVPGKAARIFSIVAEAGANIDMIVQNVGTNGSSKISFTLPAGDLEATVTALESVQAEVGFSEVQSDDAIGKLSIVGAGMRSNPGVSATLFQALAEAGINLEMISTSEIRISVVTRADQLDDAVRAAHTAFDLDSDEGEAVVYGGTGR
ncbi:aspartate kinase [Micrococcales bacterium 31B]|nr:aspartate kinase [Micrococcales bacterium 31B]